MSMLSAQCDNLRMMARLVLDYEPKEVRRALREAADTIWQLRNDCVELRDENEKLRKLCSSMLTHMRSDGCEGCVCKGQCDEGELDECVEVTQFAREMRDLGVEVDK